MSEFIAACLDAASGRKARLRASHMPGALPTARGFRGRYRRQGGFLLAVAATLAATVGGQRASAAEILIELASHAQVDEECVRLADVAEISAMPGDRVRLADLDLAAFDKAGAPRLISRRVIEMRLRLAGYSPDEVRIEGADEVIVASSGHEPLTDARVEQTALATISRQLGVPEDELRVTLTGPVVDQWRRQVSLPPHVRLEVLPAGETLLGRVSCHCRLFDGARLIASHPAAFQVVRRHHVLVAAASLDRGQTIQPALLREEIRYLDAPIDELAITQVEGRSLRMPVAPGETLTLRHLAEVQADERETVIRSRDAVRVIARKGALTVVMREAEATQNGKVGQLIRVRNLESNRIITGRVTGPGEVMIDLQ